MPVDYGRRLTGRERSTDANRHLGYALAFVAGATNAGGYHAIRQYVSHMTGIVATIASQLSTGAFAAATAGALGLASFMAGAACCAMLVLDARRRGLHSEFALPLIVEAGALLCFGALGSGLLASHALFAPLALALLCFSMGLQNALITKISRAEIRTTHMTGIVTDIGIELGKLANRRIDATLHGRAGAGRLDRLQTLASIGGSFLAGAFAGALGFAQLGYACTIALALVLLAAAIVPIVDDTSAWLRDRRGPDAP